MIDRQGVLNAALEVFSTRGIHATGYEQIAEQAGVEPAAVRALFTTKDDILLTLLKDATDPITSAVSVAAADATDPADMLRRSLPLLDQWMLDHPRYARVLLYCMLEHDTWTQEIYEHSLYPSEFFEQLQRFIDAGKLRQTDLAMFGLILDSLLFFPHMVGSGLLRIFPNMTPEEIFAQRLAAISDLFVNGLYNRR